MKVAKPLFLELISVTYAIEGTVANTIYHIGLNLKETRRN